jgi:hypothetical protein
VTIKCIQEIVLVTSSAHEYVFAIVRKLELVPTSAERFLAGLGIREHVECGKWLPVKVTEVIKKNSLSCWRGDSKDASGGVPRSQIRAMKV